MNFDDDFIRVNLPDGGTMNIMCKRSGIDWPPPETLALTMPQCEGLIFRRLRMSEITDEQRKGMRYVCRGAEYVPSEGTEP